VLRASVAQFVPPGSVHEQWDGHGLEKFVASEFSLDVPVAQWLASEDDIDEQTLVERILSAATAQYEAKTASIEPPVMRQYERAVMLQSFDSHWREHLSALDHLRQGIHLRSYAQKNPKQEYKSDAFTMFSDMLERIKADVTRTLMLVQIRSAEEVARVDEPAQLHNVTYQHADAGEALAADARGEAELPMQGYPDADPGTGDRPAPFVRPGQKVGRNDPCPCGSGRKYKVCHGRLS
jgi:preprotein translocase subunit SecA